MCLFAFSQVELNLGRNAFPAVEATVAVLPKGLRAFHDACASNCDLDISRHTTFWLVV